MKEKGYKSGRIPTALKVLGSVEIVGVFLLIMGGVAHIKALMITGTIIAFIVFFLVMLGAEFAATDSSEI